MTHIHCSTGGLVDLPVQFLGYLDLGQICNAVTAVANEVDDRFVFPMAMAETALLIDAYEGMTPEEKVGMGYIFRNLIPILFRYRL
mgnify:CR=1 FL=1